MGCDAPSYSAIRALLGVLEEKGDIRHEADGLKCVHMPTVSGEKAHRLPTRVDRAGAGVDG